MSEEQLRFDQDDIQNILDQIKKDVEESSFSLLKPFLNKAQIKEINSITLTTVDFKKIKCDESIHKIEDKDYITKKINQDYREKLFLENQTNYFSLLKVITHCLALFEKQAFDLQLYESERNVEDGLSRSYEEIKNNGIIDELKEQTQINQVVTREQLLSEATNNKRANKRIENIFNIFPELINDYEYLQLMNTMKSIFERWFEYYSFPVFEKNIIDSVEQKTIETDKPIMKTKSKGGRPKDAKIQGLRNNLYKDYYNLTEKEGLKKKEAIKRLEKIFPWKKSTIEKYIKG